MHISPAYFFPSTFWICCFRGFQETLAKNTFLLQFCLGQTIDCLRFTRLLWEMAPSGGKVVFEKEGISKLNKSLQAWSPFLSIWKHKILCITGIFSFIILLQLRWPIEWKNHRFVMLCMFGYTKWEYWSLKITQSVQCFTISNALRGNFGDQWVFLTPFLRHRLS